MIIYFSTSSPLFYDRHTIVYYRRPDSALFFVIVTWSSVSPPHLCSFLCALHVFVFSARCVRRVVVCLLLSLVFIPLSYVNVLTMTWYCSGVLAGSVRGYRGAAKLSLSGLERF